MMAGRFCCHSYVNLEHYITFYFQYVKSNNLFFLFRSSRYFAYTPLLKKGITVLKCFLKYMIASCFAFELPS